MSKIRERLESPEVAGLVEALKRGDDVSGRVEPLDLIAAVVSASLAGEGPELVQGTVKHPKLAAMASEPRLARFMPEAPRPARLALAAGLLQVLDAWETSHEAAQEADDLGEAATSAYWHGIAHRREPDPGNASYWFRRVGKHAIFPILAEAAREICQDRGRNDLAAKLVKGGAWDPFAFISVCSAARGGSEEERVVRRIQAEEMLLLLEATAKGLG